MTEEPDLCVVPEKTSGAGLFVPELVGLGRDPVDLVLWLSPEEESDELEVIGPIIERMTGKKMIPWKRPNPTVNTNTWKM